MIDFTFVVIAFNHEQFILEHLESIAYQINSYGEGFTFQLIVADDASSDQTLALVRYWLKNNASLFRDIQIHGDIVNRGTCENYTKVWKYVLGKVCKLTAGDDVYSCENLLSEWLRLKNFDISSGYPLILTGDMITWPTFFNANIVVSNRIYSNSNYIKRLLGISFSHTPSIIFKNKVLQDEEIRKFVCQFSVTEDYPMHVKMAERLSPMSFVQSPLVHIYYRRTSGSTYIVRSKSFDKDKIKIFNYLKDHLAQGIEKYLLANRIFCYQLKSPLLRRMLNINYIIYLTRGAINCFGILYDLNNIKPDIAKYRKHYMSIKLKADGVRTEYFHSA